MLVPKLVLNDHGNRYMVMKTFIKSEGADLETIYVPVVAYR